RCRNGRRVRSDRSGAAPAGSAGSTGAILPSKVGHGSAAQVPWLPRYREHNRWSFRFSGDGDPLRVMKDALAVANRLRLDDPGSPGDSMAGNEDALPLVPERTLEILVFADRTLEPQRDGIRFTGT